MEAAAPAAAERGAFSSPNVWLGGCHRALLKKTRPKKKKKKQNKGKSTNRPEKKKKKKVMNYIYSA